MRDLSKTLARLQAFRSRFEGLLAAAQKSAAGRRMSADQPSRLRELRGFGTNPGNLRMFAYAPEHLAHGAPLVIALHGCTQSAADYDRGTGWSSLADSLGFAVVYPQQQPANNPKNCFSWFLPGDTVRGEGEALSIRQMVEHAIKAFSSNRSKVFATGLSAGGAMTSVLLATYPEVFAGGAIIAGLPYGCANNVQQAFEAMFAAREYAPQALGDRVRAASNHRGPWPTISVWHGTGDPIVKPSNGDDIVRQWADVHGLSRAPSDEELVDSHRRRVWRDAKGKAQIEAFSINGMAHGVPLATTTEESCGSSGAFFLDVGISSTHRIARFWHLQESVVETRRAVTRTPAIIQANGRPVILSDVAAKNANAPSPPLHARWHERQFSDSSDPNAVIAAAFEAAGLPVPELHTASGSPQQVSPGPIIAAALKGAGLAQR